MTRLDRSFSSVLCNRTSRLTVRILDLSFGASEIRTFLTAIRFADSHRVAIGLPVVSEKIIQFGIRYLKYLQNYLPIPFQAHSIENETFCSKLNLDLDYSVHIFVICNNQTFHNLQNFSLIPLVFLCIHKLKYMNILCTNYQCSLVFFKHRWYT